MAGIGYIINKQVRMIAVLNAVVFIMNFSRVVLNGFAVSKYHLFAVC